MSDDHRALPSEQISCQPSRVGHRSVLSANRVVSALLLAVAISGCGDETIRLDSAVPRELDDRVIDVFTTIGIPIRPVA